MKNLNLVLGVFLSATLLFASCSKEEVATKEMQNNTQHSETLNELKMLSNDFIISQERLATNDERCILCWWNFLHPDVFGGAIGMWYCGLGGPIIIGGGASVDEASEGETFSTGTIRPGAGYTDNPLDHLGRLHVEILHNSLTVDSEIMFTGTELDREAFLTYAADYLTAEGTMTAEEINACTIDDLNMSLDWAETQEGFTASEILTNMHNEGTMLTLDYDLLSPYVTALDASSSFADFYDYSVASENAIMDDPDLPEENRNTILSFMATTRHDYSYWE